MKRGKYIYFRNGERINITEEWLIEMEVILSTRQAPAFGSHILVNTTMIEEQIVVIMIEWVNHNPGAVRQASAVYKIEDKILRVEREIDGVKYAHEFPLAERPVIMPLMRVFTGSVIREIVARCGAATVLVPNILDPTNHTELLAPILETRHASLLDAKTRCYQYTGGNYDADARFWLDETGLLVRYQFGEWVVQLES